MENFVLSELHASLPPMVRDIIRALDVIPAGITVADLDGRLLYLNRRILNSLGYTREELLGKNLQVLYGSSLTQEQVEAIRKATIETGWQGEVRNYRKDGSSFPVFLETKAIRDEEGNPLVAVGVARDISEQRAFQERLRMETKLGTLGLIAHNVTHEVRNHLSALKMSLYMLEEDAPPSEEQARHFTIAREELGRIELFLQTLENYVNPPHPSYSRCDLSEVVNEAIANTRPLLIQKAITLYRQFPSTPPMVRIDRGQFVHAITQVVQNASEAMDAKGEIHAVIKRQKRNHQTCWKVEIRDNGPGVAPHIRSRVFEPFFTTNPKRIGLGLSNVARVVELHGGRLQISSPRNQGTVVTLVIPEGGAEDG